jgi:LacI family transcriptional regulator
MVATVKDVAQLAGVSAMSVSRVINDQPGVSVETRRKVEKAIAQLNYAPSRIASSLVSAKTQTIGLIVPDVSNPFFAPIVRGAETAARKAGYRVLLCNSESDLRLERDYVSDLVSHRVEGLIVAPVGDKSKGHLGQLVQGHFPLVLIDRHIAGLDCDSVTLDNVTSARKMVDHLLSVGHRRIAHITDSDDVSTGRERLQGFKEALAGAGVAFSSDLVFHTSADQSGGYRTMQQILDLDPRPSAVFAVNNMTAVGAVQAVREAQLNVPNDISLVCFDDVQHLAVVAPFLTVIDQPAETMGSVAAQLLLERIGGRAGERSRRITFQGKLIVRASCGSQAMPAASGRL